MATNLLRVFAILLTAITLSAALAHLFSLPNKMHLSADEYFAAQQIYAGWNRIGIAVILALIACGALTLRLRGQPDFGGSLAATVLIASALAVFFMLVFPANQATVNWTQRPATWDALRRRWEYGHALSAVLYFGALVCLTWSTVVSRRQWGP